MKKKILICALIGHKWRSRSIPTTEDFKKYGVMGNPSEYRIKRDLSHCRRCGEPNPAWETEN